MYCLRHCVISYLHTHYACRHYVLHRHRWYAPSSFGNFLPTIWVVFTRAGPLQLCHVTQWLIKITALILEQCHGRFEPCQGMWRTSLATLAHLKFAADRMCESSQPGVSQLCTYVTFEIVLTQQAMHVVHQPWHKARRVTEKSILNWDSSTVQLLITSAIK